MTVFTDEQKVQLLADLIAIQSVNDHEELVAQYLKRVLTDHDIDARIVPVLDELI